ncbi:MAG: chemotaxis protein CheW [Myxococcales bacterium]|nr:chemotaxis protein CheW [Myxococcales bacterium]
MGSPISASRRIGSKNLVGFEVGSVLYALDIGRVREIIRPLPSLPLPHMPASVIGVADHRGDVVPVVDLRERFGLPTAEDTKQARWIVVTRDSRLVALIVDRVTEVFGGDESRARQVPEMGDGDDTRGITGVYAYQDQLAFVLDPDRVAAVSEEIDMSIARELVEQGRAK